MQVGGGGRVGRWKGGRVGGWKVKKKNLPKGLKEKKKVGRGFRRVRGKELGMGFGSKSWLSQDWGF